MTYASTDHDPVTITVHQVGVHPHRYHATVAEHEVNISDEGVLRIQLPGRTVCYAPGTWERVDSAVTDPDEDGGEPDVLTPSPGVSHQ